MLVKIDKPQEVFAALKLKEHTVYRIRVKLRANNTEHTAILSTGFTNGNNCKIWNATYSEDVDMMSAYMITIIKKLYEQDNS